MRTLSSKLLFLALLLTGCSSEPKDFTLTFTMESLQNYKYSIEIASDKSYHTQQQNLYLDAHANTQQINTFKGTLTDEQFDNLTKLIAASRLFNMKDTYGFDQEPDHLDTFGNVISQLNYTEGKKVKNITIRLNSKDLFPKQFLELMNFLSHLAPQT